MLSAKAKASNEPSEDIKSDFKSSDFFGIFGADYTLPGIGLILSARYQAGLSNVGKDTGGDTKITNSAFTVTVGYTF